MENKVISSEQSVILSMLHGMWQHRCISLVVGFDIPELLCNTEQPSICIDDIAAKTGCKSSKQLYPIMRVLAQWGIGRELENKHFAKNKAMELLRRDNGPSLGHMVYYFGSEEHFTAFKSLPKSVRECTTPAFVLEHGMSLFEYMNDITNHQYDAKRMFRGASQHAIGTDERRQELADVTIGAMDYLCYLTVLPDKDVNNVYKVFPWSSCNTLVDMGGNSGKFLASVLKQSGCEHLHGYVVELPDVVDKVQENVEALGVQKSRLKFIKQDFTKPFPADLQLEADTVMIMNTFGWFLSASHDTAANILHHTKSIFSRNGGRFLIIDMCSPDPGNHNENVGVNGRQLGFHSMHLLSTAGEGFRSKSEWIEVLTKVMNNSGYKLNHIYDTFPGGFTIFELMYKCENNC